MTPCVAYTRVSSEEQAKVGYSIPFQRARVEQLARERSFDLLEVVEDVHSAKQVGRPGFARLLRYLEEHTEVRDVLVHRVDRLIRNHYEYGLIVEQLGVRVHSVVEPAEDNAAGRLMHGMNVVVAKYHSDNLGQEVSKGQRAKFEAGGCSKKAPIGYKNVSRTRTEKATVVVDLEQAPLVELLFRRYATGRFSLRTLACELYDQGLKTKSGKPYPPDRIRRVLADSFYIGRIRYCGEERDGLHPPLISPELWHRVQRVAKNRSADTGEKGKKFFLLRGLVACGTCGRNLTAEDHPKGSYYRCLPDRVGTVCPARYIPVAELDRVVVDLLPKIALLPDHRNAILASLERLQAERDVARRRETSALLARRDKLEARHARLTDLVVDGTLSREDYRRKNAEYERDHRAVEARRTFLNADLSEDIAYLRATLDRSTALRELFDAAGSDNDRKMLLREIFAVIRVDGTKFKEIEYNPPFHLLLGDARAGSGMDLEGALLEEVAERRGAGGPLSNTVT
jgi:site-specific DNA recombinase